MGDTTADVDWDRLKLLAKRAATRWRDFPGDTYADACHEAMVAGWEHWATLVDRSDATIVWFLRCRVIDVWRLRDGRAPRYVRAADGRTLQLQATQRFTGRAATLSLDADHDLHPHGQLGANAAPWHPIRALAEQLNAHHDTAEVVELLDHYGITCPRERLVVLGTVAGWTSQEIADRLGVTESRVSQLRRAMADRLAPLAGRRKPAGTAIRHNA